MIQRLLQMLVNFIARVAIRLGMQLEAPAPWFLPNCRGYRH
jgi:hypothetical protein